MTRNHDWVKRGEKHWACARCLIVRHTENEPPQPGRYDFGCPKPKYTLERLDENTTATDGRIKQHFWLKQEGYGGLMWICIYCWKSKRSKGKPGVEGCQEGFQ